MKVELLTEDREEEYSRLLLRDERALFNNSLKFRELLRQVTDATDYYLIVLEGGRIVGALPTFLKLNSDYGSVADIRETPVKDIIKELQQCGVDIFGYDSLLDDIEA